ncbi:MAG: outer membrane lipoprotein-sorting protein [Candidatus Bipolaricaulia bacterium]
MFKNATMMAAALLFIGLVGTAAVGLTADEIYDLMDAEADALGEGSMVSIIKFYNVFSDGKDNEYLFGSLSKPGRSLIYFIEPSDLRGSVFLTHEAATDDESNRLWIYVPYFGAQPGKELVTEEDRSGSFAGSSLSYEDIGDRERRADYDALLLGEEELVIGELARSVYVIESTAKADADVETLRTVIWIDTEFLIMLKMEGYNDLGNLESTMEVLALGEFEGKLTPDEMLATNVSDDSSTTITFLDRQRLDEEIPEDVFQSENLHAIDPTAWGF